jgi:hypothetical protein
MRLICVRTKAEYFCAKGWTGFGDLPVVPIGRRLLHEVALARKANQFVTRRQGDAQHRALMCHCTSENDEKRSFTLRLPAAHYFQPLSRTGFRPASSNSCASHSGFAQ